jgi:membrane-associated phospholipid phosphatase
MPLSALYQDQVIVALRQHAVHSIDLGAMHGLVCAPSFHAASAVIYIATAVRIRGLRWPLLILNGGMLFATPVEGTHYLADLLSGMVVACLALWLAPALIRWTERAELTPRFGIERMTSVAAE